MIMATDGDVSSILVFSVLVAVFTVSGCVSQGNGSSFSTSEVFNDPANFEGQQIEIRGSITSNSPDVSVDLDWVKESISNESFSAWKSDREIGNIDGELDFTGQCYQNEYASEVVAEGVIESYETCNCNFETRTIEKNGKSKYFIAHENGSIVETKDRDIATDLVGFPSGESSIREIDGRILQNINDLVKIDLIEKLDLNGFSQDQVISRQQFWANGSKADSSTSSGGVTNLAPSVGSASLEEYKYTISEEAVIIQEDEVEKRNEQKKLLSGFCEDNPEFRESSGPYSGEYTVTEFKGCEAPKEKNYYFSCRNVKEQIE